MAEGSVLFARQHAVDGFGVEAAGWLASETSAPAAIASMVVAA
jgi:hypothetical protein